MRFLPERANVANDTLKKRELDPTLALAELPPRLASPARYFGSVFR
jgi:hypothetical protein